VFAAFAADDVDRAVDTLKADLPSGAWQARHADLLGLSNDRARPSARQPHLQRVAASASGDEPPGRSLRGNRPRRRVDAACSSASNRPEQPQP
jgi:hypothetical protein